MKSEKYGNISGSIELTNHSWNNVVKVCDLQVNVGCDFIGLSKKFIRLVLLESLFVPTSIAIR
jgi:hypothetical protein